MTPAITSSAYRVTYRSAAGAGGGGDVRHAEQGEIITGWLLKMLLTVAVLAIIAYEVISIGVTTVALDDNAREVARAARDAYRSSQSLEAATEAAVAVADLHNAEVVALEDEGEELVITLQRQAPTLVTHRIGPLEDFTMASVTTRVSWQT